MQYFISRNKTFHGPFTAAQVKSLAKSGKLTTTDQISTSIGGPWKSVSQAMENSRKARKRADPMPTHSDPQLDPLTRVDENDSLRGFEWTGDLDKGRLHQGQLEQAQTQYDPTRSDNESETELEAAQREVESLRRESVSEHGLTDFARSSMIGAAMSHNAHALSALVTGGAATSDLGQRKARVDATVDAYAALRANAGAKSRSSLVRQANLSRLLDKQDVLVKVTARLGFGLCVSLIGVTADLVTLPLIFLSSRYYAICWFCIGVACVFAYWKMKPLQRAMMDYPSIRNYRHGCWPRNNANVIATSLVLIVMMLFGAISILVT